MSTRSKLKTGVYVYIDKSVHGNDVKTRSRNDWQQAFVEYQKQNHVESSTGMLK